MTLFRSSALVAAVSGNLGPINFVQGKNAPYMRQALRRTRRFTQPQLARRARFAYLTQIWQTLSDENRLSWKMAAYLITTPNRVAIPRRRSGFIFFVQFNLSNPTASGRNPYPPCHLSACPAPQSAVLTSSIAAGIDYTWNQTGPPSTFAIHFYGSRSFSSTPTSRFRNFRYLHSATHGLGARSEDLTIPFKNTLGSPKLTELIAIRAVAANSNYLFSFPVSAQAAHA